LIFRPLKVFLVKKLLKIRKNEKTFTLITAIQLLSFPLLAQEKPISGFKLQNISKRRDIEQKFDAGLSLTSLSQIATSELAQAEAEKVYAALGDDVKTTKLVKIFQYILMR
jgi:hypothetical protein